MKKFYNVFQTDAFSAFGLIFPAFLGTFAFIILPVLGSLFISFTKWNLINPPEFIGLQNYFELFSDNEFYFILFNTFYYAVSVAVLGIIIPLIIAIILDKGFRGTNLYKTVYFLPFITPMIVAGIVWEWIFDPSNGIMNWFLGGAQINWLYDKYIAMPAIIMVSVWKNIGYNMVIFLAGLQGIPQNLMEAAEIDGATGIKKFFNVTFPLLSPTVFFVLIITTISSFQVFDLIYLMTEGGPQNSTNVLVYWLYKNAFEFFKVGRASAIAYILFFIILILTLIQWKTRKKWVMNE
ncbi:MAG: sugar ABC transporter permease [Candidatus Gastranaerophilales bacterium]|nr:sugar ABC transporter permease [Candidatus Gastranaerophilales bacterium]